MKTSAPLRRVWVRASVLLLLMAPLPAWAVACGTVLSPVSVTASPVDFGTYNASSGAADNANGTITIACKIGADALPIFVVSLSQGQAPSYSPRLMTAGASSLMYNLYTTAAHTTVWGDGSAGTSTRSNGGLVVLGSISFTVYGQIPASQFIAAGAYADSITVTVVY